MRNFRSIYLILFLYLLASCAGQNLYTKLTQSLQSGDCTNALQMMSDGRDVYGGNAELLYLLDTAMVALQCGDYQSAQTHLHQAEKLSDALWTESITRNAASFVTNDYTIAYAGEDYERVMIHLISAIGYMITDQLDEALVEVRRLDSLLEMLNTANQKDDVYKNDAFGRYLSGVLNEADGAYDDAFIDYYLSAGIYQNEWRSYGTQLPPLVAEDLVRMAVAVDRMDDAMQLLPKKDVDRWLANPEESENSGKIVLVLFSGEGPMKIQDTMVVPTKRGPVSIAFPRIVMGAVKCAGGRLLINGEKGPVVTPLVLVSDINRIAKKSLDDKKGAIVAKALARAVAKQVAINSIANTQKEKSQKQNVAVLLNMVNLLALEKADIRCWRTLPGQIEVARVFVKPGEYSARIAACDNRIFDLGTVSVSSGETRFLFMDARYGATLSR